MRGVAWDFDGCAIELGHEPERFFQKIIRETLPPAKQCGVLTVATIREAQKQLLAAPSLIKNGIITLPEWNTKLSSFDAKKQD
jgi:hypothetical protein